MAFGKELEKVRKKAKLSNYGLARDAHVDAAYVWRLETGEKQNPSREIVLRLGQTLLDSSGHISLKDVDRLMKAAGYGPVPRKNITIRKFKK